MNTMGWNSYWTRIYLFFRVKYENSNWHYNSIDDFPVFVCLHQKKSIHFYILVKRTFCSQWMYNLYIHTQLYPMNCQVLSSPNRRACLLKFSRFSFHPAHNFSCNNWKIPPLIYLVNKWARSVRHFFQPCLFIPVCSSIRDFRVDKQNTYYFAIRMYLKVFKKILFIEKWIDFCMH